MMTPHTIDQPPSYPSTSLVNPFATSEPSTDCCGQRIPIRVVSVFIGVVELLALVISCMVVGITYARLPVDTHILYTYGTPLAFPDASLGLSISALTVGGTVIAIMFWGLHTERAALLVPHIMSQAAAGVGLLTLIAFLSIYTAVTHYEVRDQAATMILVNLIVITLFVFALITTGWFFVYCLASYRYVKLREQYRKEHTKAKSIKFHKRSGLGGGEENSITAIGQADPGFKIDLYGTV